MSNVLLIAFKIWLMSQDLENVNSTCNMKGPLNIKCTILKTESLSKLHLKVNTISREVSSFMSNVLLIASKFG